METKKRFPLCLTILFSIFTGITFYFLFSFLHFYWILSLHSLVEKHFSPLPSAIFIEILFLGLAGLLAFVLPLLNFFKKSAPYISPFCIGFGWGPLLFLLIPQIDGKTMEGKIAPQDSQALALCILSFFLTILILFLWYIFSKNHASDIR